MRISAREYKRECQSDSWRLGFTHCYLLYHTYRCDGLYHSRCGQVGGPLHLTVGTAGARLDPVDVALQDVPWVEQLILQTYGYGRLTIHNATTANFAFVGHEAKKVLDEVWIHRDRDQQERSG